MRAAVLREFGVPLTLEARPDLSPRGEEVLVRVRGTGVCHSDLHIADGRFPELSLPLVLGHEIAGQAEELGDVLVYASWGCGSCRWCVGGDEQLCPQAAEAGWIRDGGYGEFVLIPSPRYLLPLVEEVETLPLERANEALDRLRRGDVLGRLVLTP